MADKILCFGAVEVEDKEECGVDRREEARDVGRQEARVVRIYYHLEDDTIRLVETPTHNAGGVQGTLVGRQRVSTVSNPLAPHLNLSNIKVGECLQVLGRRYLVTSCDSASRTYLTSLGMAPNPDLFPHPSPIPPSKEAIPDLTGAAKLRFLGDWPKTHPLATFVNHAGQVLRFYGEWVDKKGSMCDNNGGVTERVTERVELRYYLEDNTAEIRVHHLTPHQHALTPTPPTLPTKLLRRAPIPKDVSEVLGAGSLGSESRPTLNLLGLRGGRAHLKDRRPQAGPRPGMLTPLDLMLGSEVPVCGRVLRLCECDPFTTAYYKNMLHIDQVPAEYQYLHRKLSVPPVPRTTPLDPRWLEEHPRDPLHPFPTSVTTLVGGNHAKDIRDGCEGIILRFGAKLITDKEKDKDREFVVNFYVFDSSISVFEVPRINSGLRAGMFLGRGLVVCEGGEGHVSSQDLYVGALVTLNAHNFIITSADEFTLAYMERHADQFPQANYNVALDAARRCLDHHQLTSILHLLTSHDPQKTGLVPTTLANKALTDALGGKELSRQQVSALTRRHRHLRAAPLSRPQLTHLAALHLKRHNFHGVDELRVGLRGRDKEGCGVLEGGCVRAALLATRLPLPQALTDALIQSVKDADGKVDYERLCHDLDWRLRPHIHTTPPCQLDEGSLMAGLRRAEDLTDYINLVADLEGSAATHHFAGTGLV